MRCDCRVATERCSTVSHDRHWSLPPGKKKQLDATHATLPAVGYQVRFDKRIPDNAGFVFCTTGIFVRWLLSDPDLYVSHLLCMIAKTCWQLSIAMTHQNFSHIVIDEVHEQTLDSHLLFIAIRDILVRRPTLRVIIMSATMDSKRFQDYFTSDSLSCTVLEVPSAGHEVSTLFLEDAVELTCECCVSSI